MQKAVYLLTVGLFAYIRSVTPASFETVWLKDVTEKLRHNNPDFPDDLTFHLTRGSEILTLNLKRNHAINPHADEYVARKLKDARPVLVKSRHYEKEEVAYYQDMENWAYMTVRCVKKSNEPCDRIINGNLRIGERTFALQPAETDVTSRNLVEDPDSLGRKYFLKDQNHMQREYSVQTKAESRGLKNDYHVKVAILIDSSAWDYYVSAFKEEKSIFKRRNTRTKIQEMYSHIFNGVNLLYKGIKDPDMSINVILSRFIYFETYKEFPHNKSQPVLLNKTHYINAKDYLGDVNEWDYTKGRDYKPGFDHAMLITRYKLFEKDLAAAVKKELYISADNIMEAGIIESNQSHGLFSCESIKMLHLCKIQSIAGTGEVCVIGGRNAVVTLNDFNAMVITVAHELGHSLGAIHDGTNGTLDCRAEDHFIMSPSMAVHEPKMNYSRNPWLFSHCSVRSFKDTLKNKYCVTIKGDYYDKKEYNKNVEKEAGEVYSANEQCELIYGNGSYVCETETANVCRLMKCYDPEIPICRKDNYVAARGTRCGVNMDKAAKCMYEVENVAVLPN